MPRQEKRKTNKSKIDDENSTLERKMLLQQSNRIMTRAQRRKMEESLDNSKSTVGTNISTKRKLNEDSASGEIKTKSKKRKMNQTLDNSKSVDSINIPKKRKLENCTTSNEIKPKAKRRKTDYVLNPTTEHIQKTRRVLKVVSNRLTEEDLKRATTNTSNLSKKHVMVTPDNGTKTFERNPKQSNVKRDLRSSEKDTNEKANVVNNDQRESEQKLRDTTKETSAADNSKALVKPDFVLNEIIWAKIKGSAHWPAKIERMVVTASGLLLYDIKWYNDYRRSKIHRTQAFKFLQNFEKYAVKFDHVIGLRTAAFEAMYEYRRQLQ